MQLPTTLPTLDELIGREGIEPVSHLLELTRASADHVFTAHAELEGGQLAPMLEQLLSGWKAQGYEVVSLAALFHILRKQALPKHEVIYGEVPGRSGTLALQGPCG